MTFNVILKLKIFVYGTF